MGAFSDQSGIVNHDHSTVPAAGSDFRSLPLPRVVRARPCYFALQRGQLARGMGSGSAGGDARLRSVLAELTARAAALAADGRALLGIAGAPGAGKSTVALAVTGAVPGSVVVPMDGFHLSTARLTERGWVAERGTPRTFDGAGYVDLLRRLRAGGTVRAPAYDRSIEEPVPDVIEVPADARLIITEGNYLLLDTPPWSSVRELLDEVWYVEVAEQLRLQRLIDRHVAFGRTPDQARWRATQGSDAANAAIVAASRDRADLIVRMNG